MCPSFEKIRRGTVQVHACTSCVNIFTMCISIILLLMFMKNWRITFLSLHSMLKHTNGKKYT